MSGGAAGRSGFTPIDTGPPCGGDCVTVPAEVDALTAERDALQARLDEATSTIDTLEEALRDLQADHDEEQAGEP